MYKKILVPLDGSHLAEAALPHAINLAKDKGAELVLFHAQQPSAQIVAPYVGEDAGFADPAGLPLSYDEHDALRAEQAGKYLSGVKEKLGAEGINVSVVIQEGRPATSVVDFAKHSGVDIIVMSTHGRSGVARWYLGSVADKIVHAATVPVMLIRSKES